VGARLRRPLYADVTPVLREGQNAVVVRAEDPSRDATIPRGKLIVFIIAQRYIIQGVAKSGLKG
jgi:hypothetical protein